MPRELADHRRYLQDQPRIDAFARGIDAAVRRGDVVVDLGCGTGILGLLALRAGASRVYAIDDSGMAEVAEAIFAANGFGDRVRVIREHSTLATLPERADVVVSDQVGHFGFEAGALQFFADARARFLKPGGRCVPRTIGLWVAPFESPDQWGEASFWSTRPHGFDMSPAQEVAWNSGHDWRVEAHELLAPGRRALTLDAGAEYPHLSFVADVAVARTGTLHGVAGWFSAEMTEGAAMSNAPGDSRRIDRRNTVFAIRTPVDVVPGQVVRIDMAIRPSELIVRWLVEVWASDEALRAGDARGRLARFEQTTFRGMLIARADMMKTRPSFVPRLTERGRARQLVLELANGRSTVAEIERAVLDRHPALFADPSAAGGFVAEVVVRYAE
jgi:protein arginine N-methyltransferase 1